MEKLKIVINGNENIAKEANELFEELGYYVSSENKNNFYGWSLGENQGDYYINKHYFDIDTARLVTIEELRALVSLHKNPINMDKVLNEVRSDALGLLEDKPMKEYLKKYEDGKYVLMDGAGYSGQDNWIEIPDGAELAIYSNDEGLSFAKHECGNVFIWSIKTDSDWDTTKWDDWDEFTSYGFDVVWQRHTQPEELPFIDDGITDCREAIREIYKPSDFGALSLNDQYAEIENTRQEYKLKNDMNVDDYFDSFRCADAKPNQTTINAMNEADASIADTLNERQSTYGSFEDVALTTQKIMDAIAWARGQDKLPAPHHEALHMIASKMARIVNGDHNHKDSWHDIAGYATLVERLL